MHTLRPAKFPIPSSAKPKHLLSPLLWTGRPPQISQSYTYHGFPDRQRESHPPLPSQLLRTTHRASYTWIFRACADVNPVESYRPLTLFSLSCSVLIPVSGLGCVIFYYSSPGTHVSPDSCVGLVSNITPPIIEPKPPPGHLFCRIPNRSPATRPSCSGSPMGSSTSLPCRRGMTRRR